MRKLLLVLVPFCALASPITIDPASLVTFADCASGGSDAQTVPAGDFLVTVTDEDVWVCYAATCATLGTRLPNNTVIHLKRGASGSVSCRSAGDTGDIQFTAGS